MIGIFPKAQNLQEDGLWEDTIDLLLKNQFLIEYFNQMSEGLNIAIRSDSYLEKVISDYPPPHRQARLEQDLSKLLDIFLDLGDVEALLSLSFSFMMQELYEKALEASNRSLTLNDNDTIVWTNKGLCLTQLKSSNAVRLPIPVPAPVTRAIRPIPFMSLSHLVRHSTLRFSVRARPVHRQAVP